MYDSASGCTCVSTILPGPDFESVRRGGRSMRRPSVVLTARTASRQFDGSNLSSAMLDFPLLALLAPMGPELPSDIRRDSRRRQDGVGRRSETSFAVAQEGRMRISSANTMTRCNSGLQTRGGSCNANSPHDGACPCGLKPTVGVEMGALLVPPVPEAVDSWRGSGGKRELLARTYG